MKKDELTTLLRRISIDGRGENANKLIRQSLFPLMQSSSPDQLGVHPVKLAELAISDAGQADVLPLRIKYVVRDAALVTLAWRKAFAGALQLEPCGQVETDASLADGVTALLEERPVLTIVAVDDDTLQLQIGGFDQSMVVHPGNLMDLSRQVIEGGARGGRRRR